MKDVKATMQALFDGRSDEEIKAKIEMLKLSIRTCEIGHSLGSIPATAALAAVLRYSIELAHQQTVLSSRTLVTKLAQELTQIAEEAIKNPERVVDYREVAIGVLDKMEVVAQELKK